MKEVTVIENGGALVAMLHCEIDHHSVKCVREEIDRRMESSDSSTLIMDFSGVGFMDSSGIGLILGRAEAARLKGRRILLRSLSPSMLRILRMSGIERIKNLKIDEDLK